MTTQYTLEWHVFNVVWPVSFLMNVYCTAFAHIWLRAFRLSCSPKLPAHRSCVARLCKQVVRSLQRRRLWNAPEFDCGGLSRGFVLLCLLLEIKSHEATRWVWSAKASLFDTGSIIEPNESIDDDRTLPGLREQTFSVFIRSNCLSFVIATSLVRQSGIWFESNNWIERIYHCCTAS